MVVEGEKMGEPKQLCRLPRSLLIGLLLLGTLTVAMHGYWTQPPAHFSALSALVLAVGLLFVVGRHLLNYSLALLLASALLLHPATFQVVRLENNPLAVEVWPLAALLCLTCLWECLFASEINVLAALTAGVILSLVGGLAWLTRARVGLEVALLSWLGLLLPAFLAGRRRRQAPEGQRPHLGNVITGFMLALLTPIAGLLLLPLLAEGLWWCQQHLGPVLHRPGLNLLPTVAAPPEGELDLLAPLGGVWQPEPWKWVPTGFAEADLERWAWPLPALVLILMVYGLWRCLYTGRRRWPTRHVPLSWLLLLFALVVPACVVINPTGLAGARYYPLTILAVLLALFGVGDYLREVGQRLVLPPPDEIKPE